MIHARKDYSRIQDPALLDSSLLSDGSTPIAEDEPVFLVRAKDRAFVETLESWAECHLDNGGSREMAEAVWKHIDLAIEWQKKHGVKVADAPDGSLS